MKQGRALETEKHGARMRAYAADAANVGAAAAAPAAPATPIDRNATMLYNILYESVEIYHTAKEILASSQTLVFLDRLNTGIMYALAPKLKHITSLESFVKNAKSVCLVALATEMKDKETRDTNVIDTSEKIANAIVDINSINDSDFKKGSKNHMLFTIGKGSTAGVDKKTKERYARYLALRYPASARANAARLAAFANNEGDINTYEKAKSRAGDLPIDSMQYRLARNLYDNLVATIKKILPVHNQHPISTYLADKESLYIDTIKDEIFTFIRDFPDLDLSIEMLVGFLHTRLENNPDILCAISLLLNNTLPKSRNAPASNATERARVADIKKKELAHTVAQILVKGIEKCKIADNLQKDADGKVIGLIADSQGGFPLCHAALSRDYSALDSETHEKVSRYLEGWVEPAPNAPFAAAATSPSAVAAAATSPSAVAAAATSPSAEGGKRKTRKRSSSRRSRRTRKSKGRKTRKSKLRI